LFIFGYRDCRTDDRQYNIGKNELTLRNFERHQKWGEQRLEIYVSRKIGYCECLGFPFWDSQSWTTEVLLTTRGFSISSTISVALGPAGNTARQLEAILNRATEIVQHGQHGSVDAYSPRLAHYLPKDILVFD
jgi:hypothetical protein